MIRFSLSKIFATFAPSTNRGKDARLFGLGRYRDEILNSAKAVLDSKGIEMTVRPGNYGQADFEVRLPDAATPCKFHLSTECSGFLLHTGREAIVRITNDSAARLVNEPGLDPNTAKFGPLLKAALKETAIDLFSPKTFAYGSSYNPESYMSRSGQNYVTSFNSEEAIAMDRWQGNAWKGIKPEPPVRYRDDIRKVVNYIEQQAAKVSKPRLTPG